MGFAKTLTYYMVDRIISVISNEDLPEEPDKDCYYFNANKHVVLVVNKHFFDNFDYIKAMVGMLAECFAPKTHIEDIVTKDYWLGQLGSLYTKNTDKMMDSGKSTMRFFERLLDLTSKDVLKINQVNKISIYSIVRWMVQNFPELRQKNNLDLSTKRLRLGECIASLLSMRIGESVNRILTFGNKVDIDQVITNIFSFSGNLKILGQYRVICTGILSNCWKLPLGQSAAKPLRRNVQRLIGPSGSKR
jgi:hypothetical protein